MQSYDDDKKNVSCPWLVIALGLIALVWFLLPQATGIISIYRLGCPDVLATGEKCEQPAVPTISTYRVFIDKQFVISKNVLITYDDCDVYDRKNWECRTAQMIIKMNGGKETVMPRSEGYSSQTAYNEASQTLLNESLRNPQIPFWRWTIEFIRYRVRTFR